MSSQLTSNTLRRAKVPCGRCCEQQVRHATLLRRPHRPYTMTQVVTLTDGSTYTQRTTSPQPLILTTKDTRNHPLWQPSLLSLQNIEQDEAGRLRAFRKKFGRGWDLDADVSDPSSSSSDKSAVTGQAGQGGELGEGKVDGKTGAGKVDRGKGEGDGEDAGDSLMDLISGGYGSYGGNEAAKPRRKVVAAADPEAPKAPIRPPGKPAKLPKK